MPSLSLTAAARDGRIVLVCPTVNRTIESVPLQVRRDGPLPIAGQIAEQLVALVRSGRLRAGERLPPVRVLAGFLRVNRNTVGDRKSTRLNSSHQLISYA